MIYDVWIVKDDKETWVGHAHGTPSNARCQANLAWPEMKPENIMLLPSYGGGKAYATFKLLMGRDAR